MEALFSPIIAWLEYLATTVSLEVFVVVGAFLEEIIAPIPSPFVVTTAAVLAQVQGYSLLGMASLAVLAALGKTVSTYLVYVIVDKTEDLVIGRYGRYVGVSHAHVERLGKLLTKTWWDDVLLFLARAIPIVPTFPISVAAGFIKYNVRSYVGMTFLGTLVRNALYMWVAFFGWEYFQNLKTYLWDNPIWLFAGGVLCFGLLYGAVKVKDAFWDQLIEEKDPV